MAPHSKAQQPSRKPRFPDLHPFVRARRMRLVRFNLTLLVLLLVAYAVVGDPFATLVRSAMRSCLPGSNDVPCLAYAPDFIYILTTVIAIAGGFALATVASRRLFWASWSVICLAWLLLSAGPGPATSLTGWPFALIGFMASSLYAVRLRHNYEVLTTARIRASFGNQLPEAHVQRLVRYPSRFNRKPTSHLVTLLHVGYADFANTAETLSPEEAFTELQRITHSITEIVHRYGGSVGRRDGNSTLAFFGYTFDGKEETDFRVDNALDCAIAILRQSLKDSLDAASRGKLFCPLRVTLNTTAAYFGDIGDEESWNLILMGPGVSLTQQLEESCDEFRLLMSATTRDMIRTFDPASVTISRRFLQIRYHRELIEAYDVDPFVKEAEEISRVLTQYREMVSIQRKEPRWPVPNDTPVAVTSDFGAGSVMNFSLSGLAIRMGVYLARGVDVALQLDNEDGRLGKALAKAGLQFIPAEVRWAKLAGDQFVHGLRLKNLTADQRVALMNALRDVVRATTPDS